MNDDSDYEEQAPRPVQAGLVKTGGMGDIAARGAETAAMAVGAKLKQMVQARFITAWERPRSIDQVRVDVLADCKRPFFAAMARYRVPRGKVKNEQTGRWEQNFIEGPSIRFAEAALRAFGNAEASTTVLFEDDEKRILRCEVIDFEKNLSWPMELTVTKTIERRELKKGQVPLGSRANSYGETVYLLPAGDDDMSMKQGSAVSKALRTLILRVLPADIVEEAMSTVKATIARDAATDPRAAMNRLIDAFAGVGVKPVDLIEYMGGRQLDSLNPADIVDLQGVFAAIREASVRWPDVLASSPHRGEMDPDTPEAKRAAATRETIGEKAKAIREKRAPKAAPTETPAQPPPAAEKPVVGAPRPGVDEPPEDWQPTDTTTTKGREPGQEG